MPQYYCHFQKILCHICMQQTSKVEVQCSSYVDDRPVISCHTSLINEPDIIQLDKNSFNEQVDRTWNVALSGNWINKFHSMVLKIS